MPATVAELASQLSAAVVIEAETARRQRAADLRAQDVMRARAEAAEDTARQLQTELEQARAALAAAKVDGEARRVANASLRSANASLRAQLADVKDRIAAAVVGMEPGALRDATNDPGPASAAASSPQPQPRRESFSAKARTFAERLVAATQSGCDRSGRQFDMVVAALFRVHGYEAMVIDGPNDGGIDIRLWRDGVLSLVQCKCKSKRYKVCAEEVRRFAADVQEHRSELERESVAFFVTSTDYVREAAEVAPHMLVGGEGAPKLQLWGAHDLFCLALLHHDALRQDECAAARHAMLSVPCPFPRAPRAHLTHAPYDARAHSRAQ